MNLKRVMALATIGVLTLGACTSGTQDNETQTSGSQEDAASSGSSQGEVTIRLSSFFSDREAGVINRALEMFEEENPNINVEHTTDQERDVQLQSLRGGQSFDLMMFGESPSVPALCNAGSFISINDKMQEDDLSLDTFVPAVMTYAQWEGNYCALPMLSDVYALYYNKVILEEAGIEPPTTLEELSAAAQALTTKGANGALERVGLMPLLDYGQMHAATMTVPFDLTWIDDEGQAQLASDPNWATMLTWQKDLINFYGSEELQTFRSQLGDEFSAQHPFYTEQIAMMMDGEWRVAFIENEKPDLEYGVVPFPALNADKAGGGYIAGTVLGIPSRSENQDAAWELAKYLSTDMEVLEYMAEQLRNVPTTVEALNSEKLRENEQFASLMDIALNENSRNLEPTLAGAAASDVFTQNVASWQTSPETDPLPFLTGINDQVQGILDQSTR